MSLTYNSTPLALGQVSNESLNLEHHIDSVAIIELHCDIEDDCQTT